MPKPRKIPILRKIHRLNLQSEEETVVNLVIITKSAQKGLKKLLNSKFVITQGPRLNRLIPERIGQRPTAR